MTEQEQLIADQADLEAFARSVVEPSAWPATKRSRAVAAVESWCGVTACSLGTVIAIQVASWPKEGDRTLDRRVGRDSSDRRHQVGWGTRSAVADLLQPAHAPVRTGVSKCWQWCS